MSLTMDKTIMSSDNHLGSLAPSSMAINPELPRDGSVVYAVATAGDRYEEHGIMVERAVGMVIEDGRNVGQI